MRGEPKPHGPGLVGRGVLPFEVVWSIHSPRINPARGADHHAQAAQPVGGLPGGWTGRYTQPKINRDRLLLKVRAVACKFDPLRTQTGAVAAALIKM